MNMSLIAQCQSKPLVDGTSARDAMLVCAVVFVASLFGIMTRPLGFLAAVWPAMRFSSAYLSQGLVWHGQTAGSQRLPASCSLGL
jgi:hypothetical protein